VILLVLQMIGGIIPITSNARAATVDFHVGYLQSVDSLNPFRGLEDPSYVVFSLIYDFPFSPDQDGNWVPNLATSATCDQACMNWTYQIRQGVKWSDGTDFTADDFNFTVNYNIQNFFQLWANQPYVNRIVQCSAKTRPYCGAAQTGPWQVTVYFDRPFAPGKALLIPIIQKAQWQSISASQAQSHYGNPTPIGTGPFIADPNIYTEFSTPGTPLHFTVNPNYHPVGNHTGRAVIDNVYLQQFTDESTLVSALEAGTIDLAFFTPSGYRAVAGQPNIGEQQHLLATNYWNDIGISQCDNKTVSMNPARFDINVRRALAMATNKDYIIKTIYQGKGLRGNSLIGPLMPQWNYDPTTDPNPWNGQPANLTFDIRAANALLNQSGYTTWSGGSFGQGYREAAQNINVFVQTNAYPQGTLKTIPAGTMLSFTMAVRQEFVQEQDTETFLKAQWAQIGVNINPKIELEYALSSDVYGCAVESYIWYWSGGGPDPNYLLSIQSSYTLRGWNDNYFTNSSYDQDYVAQLAALNFTQRQTLVRAAEKLSYESAAFIVTMYPLGQWAYRTDHFTNWGNWTAHPYRQFNAYYGANPLFLELTPGTSVGGNRPPTRPVIDPGTTPPMTALVNRSVGFAGASTDPDPGETLTWSWFWGDGAQTIHQTSSAATTDTANHAWTKPGSYNLTLSVFDGQLTNTSGVFQVNVLPSTGSIGWINGTVVDVKTNLPIPTATVRTSPGGFGSSADSTGVFSIAAPAGTYAVTASAPLYPSQTVTGVAVVANGTATVRFQLRSDAGWIAGTVSSTAGGPIPGAVVYALVGTQAYVNRTDSSGHYNLSLSPGTYNMNASAEGYETQVKASVSVAAGNTTTVEFQLQPIAQSSPGLSTLLIGGIGAAVVVVAATAVLLLVRRKKRKQTETKIEIPKK
jgi:ABC-type transport system substrate-binding protein